MNPPNSSTSSSSMGERRRALSLLLWIIAGLVCIDASVGLAFAFPSDPKTLDPPRLALFFDYGRSTEGRLRRMVRADPAATAPITLSGWYEPLTAVERKPKPNTSKITIYGMSHAVRLADALDHVSSSLQVRSVGAPGATTNWSYGAFLRDTGNRDSKVVVLAIMSSTLSTITTMSPMTWNSTYPMPYTQDRFLLNGDRLSVVRSPYNNFPDFVKTFQDPRRWTAALDLFAKYDPRYDPLLFRATVLDHSVIVRMLRRAYGQKVDREERGKVLDARHFDRDSEQLRIANAIVVDFAAGARRRGQIPVIYIVNNMGYSDQLFRALEGSLRTHAIPALNSAAIVSPSNPRNYLPDSHFTDENDDRLARELERIVQQQLPGKSAP